MGWWGETHSQKLEYLKRATNAGVSEVVKDAIAEGPEDLSARYKEYLTDRPHRRWSRSPQQVE